MDDYNYCPNCGAEYRPGFTRCADCDVELVDERPKVESKDTQEEADYFPSLDPLNPAYVYDPADWEHGLEPVELATLGSELEAEMLTGMLRANELRAYSQNESQHPISHYGGQAARSSPLARYRIYVHPEDEAEARALMGEATESEEPYDELALEDDVEVLANPKKRWTMGVALFVLLFGFLPGGVVLVYLLDKIFG